MNWFEDMTETACAEHAPTSSSPKIGQLAAALTNEFAHRIPDGHSTFAVECPREALQRETGDHTLSTRKETSRLESGAAKANTPDAEEAAVSCKSTPQTTSHPTRLIQTPQFTTATYSPWMPKGDDRSAPAIPDDFSDDLNRLLDKVLDSESINADTQQSVADSEGVIECSDTSVDPSTHSQRSACEHKCMIRLLMLKTPNSRSLGKDASLCRKLGLSLTESATSWSSSMETPVSETKHPAGCRSLNKVSPENDKEFTLGAARKLFSPGMNGDSEAELNTTTEDDIPMPLPREKECCEDARPNIGIKMNIESEPATPGVNANGVATKDDSSPGTHENTSHTTSHIMHSPHESGLITSAGTKQGMLPTTPDYVQSRRLSLLGELLDTPPSRVSIRKPAPKHHRHHKRYRVSHASANKPGEDPCRYEPPDKGPDMSSGSDQVQSLSAGFVARPAAIDGAGSTSTNLEKGVCSIPQTSQGRSCNRAAVNINLDHDSALKHSESHADKVLVNLKIDSDTIVMDDQSHEGTNLIVKTDGLDCAASRVDTSMNCQCQTGKANRLSQRKPSPGKQQSDDLFLTQISSSALNAIYEVVDEAVDIAVQNSGVNPIECAPALVEAGPCKEDHHIVDVSVDKMPGNLICLSQQQAFNFTTVQPSCSLETAKNEDVSPSRLPIPEEFFTQISPEALTSIMKETDEVQRINDDSAIGVRTKHLASGNCDHQALCPGGVERSELPNNEAVISASNASSAPTAKAAVSSKAVGHHRRAKQFSYPTTSQISSGCPKNVFCFRSESPLGRKNVHADDAAPHANPERKNAIASHKSALIYTKPADMDVKSAKGSHRAVETCTNPVDSCSKRDALRKRHKRKCDLGFTTLNTRTKDRSEKTALHSCPPSMKFGQTSQKKQRSTKPQNKDETDKDKCRLSLASSPDHPDNKNVQVDVNTMKPEDTMSSVHIISNNRKDDHSSKLVEKDKIDCEKHLQSLKSDDNDNRAVPQLSSGAIIKEETTSEYRRKLNIDVLQHEFVDLKPSTEAKVQTDCKTLERDKTWFNEELKMKATTDLAGNALAKTHPQQSLNNKQLVDFTCTGVKKADMMDNAVRKCTSCLKEAMNQDSVPNPEQISGIIVAKYESKSTDSRKIEECTCKVIYRNDKLSSIDNTEFKGFQTTTGTQKNIPDKSIERFASWFEEEPKLKKLETVESIYGLQPGARKALKNSHEMEESTYKGRDRNDKLSNLDKTELKGFQTAAGTKISIPDKSIERFASWFEEEPKSKKEVTIELVSGLQPGARKVLKDSQKTKENTYKGRDRNDKLSNLEKTKLKGFQTAAGTKINVPDKSIERFASWFEEEPKAKKEVTVESVSGLQPGARKVLKDSEKTEENTYKGRDRNDKLSNLDKTELKGFQTAAGTKISVPDKSIERFASWFEEEPKMKKEVTVESVSGLQPGARKVLKDSEKMEVNTYKGRDRNDKLSNLDKTELKGFQTAAGTKINVPDKSIERFASWFEEEPKAKKEVTVESVSGLQPGARKVLKDSRKTEENTYKGMDRNDKLSNIDDSELKGFQTAAGTKISVPDKSIERFASWFEEEPKMKKEATVELVSGLQPEPRKALQVGTVLKQFANCFGDNTESLNNHLANSMLPHGESKVAENKVQFSSEIGFKPAREKDLFVSKESATRFSNWFVEDAPRALQSKPCAFQDSEHKDICIGEKAEEETSDGLLENNHAWRTSSDTDKVFDAFIKGLKKVSVEERRKGDFSKLPKGFRPFKRPRMVKKSTENDPTLKMVITSSGSKNTPCTFQQKEGFTCQEFQIKMTPSDRMKENELDCGGIVDRMDTFTCTQLTEVDNCAAAFLATEGETSFTQVCDNEELGTHYRPLNSKERPNHNCKLDHSRSIDTILQVHSNLQDNIPGVTSQPKSGDLTDEQLVSQNGKSSDVPEQVLQLQSLKLSSEAVLKVRSKFGGNNGTNSSNTGQKQELTTTDSRTASLLMVGEIKEIMTSLTPSDSFEFQSTNCQNGTTSKAELDQVEDVMIATYQGDEHFTTNQMHVPEVQGSSSQNEKYLTSENSIPQKNLLRAHVADESHVVVPTDDKLTLLAETVTVTKAYGIQAVPIALSNNSIKSNATLADHFVNTNTISTNAMRTSYSRQTLLSMQKSNLSENSTSCVYESHTQNQKLTNNGDAVVPEIMTDHSVDSRIQPASSSSDTEDRKVTYSSKHVKEPLVNPISDPKEKVIASPTESDVSAVIVQENNITEVSSCACAQDDNREKCDATGAFTAFLPAKETNVIQSGTILNQVDKISKEETKHCDEASSEKSPFMSFQTGIGTKVTIPGNFSYDQADLENRMKEGETAAPSFIGFQTVGGSMVSVSETALNKVQGFFNDNQTDFKIEPNDGKITTQKKSFIKFQAASGSTGTIFEGALNKAATSFMGFQTASGSKVSISETALKQVKGIFSDDHSGSKSEREERENIQGKGSFIGPTVSISETGLKQVKGIFNDDQTNSTNEPDEREISAQTGSFMGFQTASVSTVSISETALKQVKGIFNDDQADSINECEKGGNATQRSFIGFQTANGSNVSISETALKQVEGIFSDDQTNSRNEPGEKEKENASSKESFMGFQTASGSKVSISETALKQVKGVFNDDHTNPRNEPDKRENATQRRSFMGFQTATGSKVSISDAALKQVKGIFNDDLINPRNGPDERENPTRGRSFIGFQTASGSKVSISETSLKQVKGIFNNDETNSRNEHEEKENATPKGSFVGFQTASGSKVSISEAALKQVKGIFNDQADSKNEHEKRENAIQGSFMGFQTANGSKVSISETALKQVMGVFNDDQTNPMNEPDERENATQGRSFIGFQTASGSKVSISETSLKQVKGIFNNDETNSRNEREEKENATPKGSFVGFQTASGSKVSISDAALKQVKGIFSDQADSKNEHEKRENVTQGSFMGFQTANGSKVSISETALKQVKGVFNDDQTNPMNEPDERENATQGRSFIGFQTASGSKVSISETSLKQVKGIFNNDETNSRNEHEEKENATPKGSFVGFQTASGSKVSISEAALKQVKGIFNDQADSKNEHEKRENATQGSFMGFQTANGSKVSITETALKQVKGVFNDDQTNPMNEPDERENATQGRSFIGFQTASGSKVSISETSLKQVKGIFNNDETNSRNEREEKENATPKGSFVGFQTASGSKVSISDAALKQVKGIFSDQADSKNEHEKRENVSQGSFMGFQTANGSKVSISETALKQVKGVFNDDQTNSTNKHEEKENAAPNGKFMGFQTASGSKVSISETALNQVKEIFNDNDGESGNGPPKGNNLVPSRSSIEESKVKVLENAPYQVKNLLIDGEKDSGYESPRKHRKSSLQSAEDSKIEKSKTYLRQDSRIDNVTKRSDANKLTSPSVEQSQKGSCVELRTLRSSKIAESEPSISGVKEIFNREPNQNTSGRFKSGQAGYSNEILELSERSKAFVADRSDRIFDEEVMFAGPRGCDKFSISTPDGAISRGLQQQNELHRPMDAQNFHGGVMVVTESGRRGEVEKGSERGVSSKEESAAVKERAPLNQTLSPRLASISTDRTGLGTSLKPFASTPEVFFSDRHSVKRTLAYGPVVSAPEQEVTAYEGKKAVGFRWNGPTTYKAFSYPTRDGAVSKQINQSQIKTPASTKPTTESTFTTPYKKAAVESDQNQTGAFSRPAKETSSASKNTFNNPVKANMSTHTSSKPASSSRFSAPPKAGSSAPKRTVSEAEFSMPAKKKPKAGADFPESSQETKGGRMGGSFEEWGADQDSLTLADLDKLESDAVEAGSISCVCGLGASAPASQRTPVTADALKARMEARLAQAQRIKEKRGPGGVRVRPEAGVWYRERCIQRPVPLKATVGGWAPHTYSPQQLYAFGVRESTLSVNAARAESYRFLAADFYGDRVVQCKASVRVGDGAVLVWDEASTAGKEEFCSALLDMEGVDPQLADYQWVSNHYKWIVWKLAALEVAFPQVFGGRKLTPDQVMLQLKYRYDREVDNAQRSAIKKIYEQDDTPAKVLVLCVSAIVSLPGDVSGLAVTPAKEDRKDKGPHKQTAVVELTDGWYPIRAVVDQALTRLIVSGHVIPGTKVCVCGAELVGSQEAASPLQAPADTMLKISANSCRRAHWDTRLGYHSNPQPPPLPLCSLFPDGGQVGCVDVVVVRVYPMQYMERTTGGSTVFRSERADHKVARRCEAERQQLMERVFTKLQAEFEKRAAAPDGRRSRRSGRRYTAAEVAALSCGQEMEEAAQAAADPSSVEDLLTEHQRTLLTDFRRNQQEELHREMEADFRSRVEELDQEKPKRNVVPLVKIRLAGCSTKDIDTKTEAVLTIWRPALDLLEMLTEGRRFRIYNVGVGETRGRRAGCAVALTAQRQTRYQPVPVDDNFLDVVYEPREVVLYAELTPGFTPLYGEVDAVGVVIHISPTTSFDRASGDEGQVQTVYLADDERNLVSVTIWGSITTYGLEDLLRESVMVACDNLQWRAESRGPLPALTLTEATVVSTNPREPHLRTALDHLRAALKAEPGYVEDMKEQLHRHITTPRGLATTPRGLATTPRGLAATPRGLATTPRGLTATPHGLATTPHGLATTPRGGAATSRGLATTPHGLATTPRGLTTTPHGLAETPCSLATTARVFTTTPHGGALGRWISAKTPATTPTFPCRLRQQTDPQPGPTKASEASIGEHGDGLITTRTSLTPSSVCSDILSLDPDEGGGNPEDGGQQDCVDKDKIHAVVTVGKRDDAAITPKRLVEKAAESGECISGTALNAFETQSRTEPGEVPVDSLTAKKQALQRMKARKLAMFADDTPVTPLNSSVSVKAWKAFKLPTPVVRSANPMQCMGLTTEDTNASGKKAMLDKPSDDQPGQKLLFEEETDNAMSYKDLKRTTPCVGLWVTSRMKLLKTQPMQTPPAVVTNTKGSSDSKEDGDESTTLMPQACTVDRAALEDGESKCAKSELSKAETVVAVASVADVPIIHLDRPKRTRGRPKRQLSSDGQGEGRKAKKPASLGPSRRKSTKKQ